MFPCEAVEICRSASAWAIWPFAANAEPRAKCQNASVIAISGDIDRVRVVHSAPFDLGALQRTRKNTMKTAFRVLFTVIVFSLAAVAQSETKNDLGLLLGGSFVTQRSTAGGEAINFGASVAFSADYARRITGGNTLLSIEFPFVAEPSNSVSSRNPQSIVSLATIFVVPSLRVKFVSNGGISPWVSGGFGYGISEGSEFFANGQRNPWRYQSTGAAQFGAGVDVRTPIKVFFPISLRGEVRDYYSVNNPTFGTAVQGGGQHNVVVSGGMVLSF